MRVVMVSKALVVGAYQRKLEELARLPEMELIAIVPPGWHGRYDPVPLELTHTTRYEMVVAPMAFNGHHHLHVYPTLGRLLRQMRPDILHMDEEPYNLATWDALRIADSLGAHSLFFTWQNLPRNYPWPFRQFEIVNYRRASYAIAGSQAAAAVIRTKGYVGPVAVIPQFGVDPDLFRPPPEGVLDARRNGSWRDERDFVIGYVGRLVPEKGIDVLLRACAQLPFKNWSLRLIGDGPTRQELSAMANALDINQRVDFLGRLPSTSAPAFYRALDAFVLPSLTRPNWVEQFGRVLIEAMACQVPVIGSESGEIPRVIADAGLTFPEGDAQALAERIASLASDPALHAELAMRGRTRVLAHFTHSQIAIATGRVYSEMISGGKSPAAHREEQGKD